MRTQQYRLDNQGQLFDMLADPGQTKPINAVAKGTADELTAAVTTWRKDMGFDTPRGTKGKSVDPRPIPVGYQILPRTWLPARDGEPQGDVKRSASAPNSSYFVNWKRKEDAIVWNVEVRTTGKYDVEISYTCPLDAAGSTLELTHGESKLTSKVEPGWDPPLYANQDTIARPPAESKMKEFRVLKLGTIELQRGVGPLKLQATEIPGSEVMQLLDITLTLK